MSVSSLPVPRATMIDRAVGYFSPSAGVARMKARTQLALVGGQWNGGSHSRTSTLNFRPFAGSPDSDMLTDRRALMSRSRDLSRNNPLGRGAVNNVVTSAVGTGLSLRCRIDADVLGLTPADAQAWQRGTEREFRLWGDSPDMCDAERTQDFSALQALAFRSAFDSGDVFAALPMVERNGLPYSLKVQLIEADRVTNKDDAADTATLFGGIQRDALGAPVQYHVLQQHPGSLMGTLRKWDVVPAFGDKTGRRNMVHLFDKLRPGQTRGVPYLAPVIETLKQLGDYTDAELRAALVSSMFTVFVTSETGLGLEPGASGYATGAPGQTGDLVQMGAGAIVDLNPGDKIETANPGRPNPAFEPFVEALLRQVGVALEQPFEVLIKHFSSSYSASRAAILEAWRFYRGRRAWLALMFCKPIFEAFMDEAVASGRIAADGYFDDPAVRAAYLRSNWIGDAPSQIDPLKEVNAAERRLALMLSSYSDETVALSGEDWEDVAARRSQEEKTLTALGLRPVLPDAPTQAAPVDPEGDGIDPGEPGDPGSPLAPGGRWRFMANPS